MAHTYTNLLTHALFSTKDRQPLIRTEMKSDLYAYLGGIITNLRGKPVQINPYNFKPPRWDNLRVSLWGPLSNILTAVVVGIALRLSVTHLPPNVAMFMFYLALISIGLAVFTPDAGSPFSLK